MKKLYLFSIALLTCMSVFSAQITVMNTSDSGPGSLRDAISSASSGDEIIFDPSISGSLIGLFSPININKNLTITGPVGDPVTITTGMQSRAFSISSPNFVNITWINFSDNESSSGGAIINSGTLILTNCTFSSNNSVVNGAAHGGGALYNNTGAELVVDSCTFTGNKVSPKQPASTTVTYVRGGAIYHRGATMIVSNSYFEDNSAQYVAGNTTGSALGGAIYAQQQADISSSTFYNNRAEGIDNATGGLGGAIYAYNATNSINISFSTFSENHSTGNNSSSFGGNICNDGNIVLKSSIIANGISDNGVNFFTFSGKTVTSFGGNIMNDWTGSTITLDATDLTGDPLLQSPTNINSSYTKVLPIDCSSPAIDAGNGSGAPSTDQVGQARVFGSSIDIGAYEQHATAPTVNASSSNSTICQGESTSITATISGGGSASYNWDNGLGTGQTHNITPTSTTTYLVTATNTGGCSGTNTVTVTVNPLPNVTANSNPSSSICQGEQVTLTGSGATSYSWDNGVNNGVAFIPSSTNTYTVTGTDANGCINTDDVTITVNTLPSINAGADEGICTGDQTTITATGGDTYNWDNGLGAGASQIISPSSTTTYEVTGTDLNGCENTDQVTITVNSIPTINAGVDQEVCEGDEVTLSAAASNGTITWDNGVTNGVPFTATNTTTYTATTDDNGCTATDQVEVTVNPLPTVTMGADETTCFNYDPIQLSGSPSGGTYSGTGVTGTEFDPGTAGVGTHVVTYTYQDANGCENSATQTFTVDGCASIQENALGSILVSPNPASSHVDIKINNGDLTSVQLLSATGKLIDITTVVEPTQTRVNLSNVSKGTYFLQINTVNGQTTKKIIVQ